MKIIQFSKTRDGRQTPFLKPLYRHSLVKNPNKWQRLPKWAWPGLCDNS